MNRRVFVDGTRLKKYTMMLFKRNILLLGVWAMGAHFSNAQTRFASLQDVWAYANGHNIQLREAETNKAVAGINVKQAYGAMLPGISANGAYTDNIKIQSTLIPENLFNPNVPAGTFTEATFGRRYIYNGSIAAQFDIVNTQDWFNVKAAKLNNEISGLNIAKTKMNLYQQLANAYYSYILLAEAERLSKENVKTTDSIYILADNKFKEGYINEVTVNTALINKEKAEKSLDAALQNKLLQLNNLKLLLNTTDSIALSENWDSQAETAATAVFAADPGIELSNKQLLLAKNELNNSKAAFAPTLSAVYQYNTQISANEFLNFSNSNTTPQQLWGLRLSVPIFAGNTRRYQVQKAKIEYGIKQEELTNARLQSGINDQNLLISYNSALTAFEKAKNILALYQKNDLHAERRLNEGVISLDDRLKTYSDLIANQNEYLQSMSDYFIQQYLLKVRQTNFIK
jgi:Outer membrane protein